MAMFAVYWPLRNNPYPITITMCCLGTSIALKEALRIIFGGDPVNVPYFLTYGVCICSVSAVYGIFIGRLIKRSLPFYGMLLLFLEFLWSYPS